MKVYFDDPEDEGPDDVWMGDIIVKEKRPDANMGEGEIAQNVSINRSLHEDLYLDLKTLNDKYLIAMKFTPRFGKLGDGRIADLKANDIASMVNRTYSLPEGGHCRWLKYKLPNGEIIDSLYTIIQTNYDDTGRKVENILINRAIEQLNLLRDVYEDQPNGMETMNFSKNIIFIKDTNDPFLQDMVQNKELQNVYLVQFVEGGNPGNSVKKRDNSNALQHAFITLTASSGPGIVMEEMAAGMGSYQDRILKVGELFAVYPNFDAVSEFGKIIVNFTQEYKEGRRMLIPPGL